LSQVMVSFYLCFKRNSAGKREFLSLICLSGGERRTLDCDSRTSFDITRS
jgi:hypothetical protein